MLLLFFPAALAQQALTAPTEEAVLHSAWRMSSSPLRPAAGQPEWLTEEVQEGRVFADPERRVLCWEADDGWRLLTDQDGDGALEQDEVVSLSSEARAEVDVTWRSDRSAVAASLEIRSGGHLMASFQLSERSGTITLPGGAVAFSAYSYGGDYSSASSEVCFDVDGDGAVSTGDDLSCARPGEPLRIAGGWWVAMPAPDGATLTLEPTTETRALVRGAVAPPLSGEGLADAPAPALGDFAGRWVILDFWATWCGGCVMEHPRLAALDGAHPDVDVLGVAVNDDPRKIRRYLRREGYDWPQLLTPRGSALVEAYNARGIPKYALIGPDGTLQALGRLDTIEAALAAR